MAGAFGGLLAGVITQYMDGVGNTPGWQWVSQRRPPSLYERSLTSGVSSQIRKLFVIEGLGTVCIAVTAVFILPGE